MGGHDELPTEMRWFTLALCLSLSLAAEDGSLWTSESSVPWGARAGLVAESVETDTNKMMFVVGGSNATSHLLNDVYRSTDGTTWQLATSAASWTPRTNPALGDLGDKVLLTGGSEGTTFFNSVYSTTDGATWTELTSNAPWGGRRSHSLATINGTILLMGGFKGATSTTTSVSYNDVWKSSDGVTWTELTSRAPWRARKRLSARTLNGQVVVCGGATASIVRYNDVWVTWDGIQWSNMTDAPWTPRQGQRSAIRGGRMWLIGGDDGTFLNDVWSTDNARNWIQATSQASWLGRTGFALAAMGHNMIVTGGSGNTLATQFLDGLYINAESAQTPMISPDGRTLEKDATVTVSMMTKTAGAAIHYVIDTKDNTMPDQSSTVYDGPIILKAKKHTQTIKAVAYKDGLQPSGVAMQTFVGYDPSSAATRSAPLYFLVLAVSALFTLV